MDSTPLDPHLSRINTRWTLVMQAHQGHGGAHAAAQRELLQRYCGAVYRYLVAALRDPDAAEELCQEFALRFVRGDFKRADPGRGRFRDYVKQAVCNLVRDHRRRLKARPQQPLPEADDLPASDDPQAGREFTDRWREELLNRAWEALDAQERASGRLYYTVLRRRSESPQTPTSRLAEQLSAEKGRPISDAAVRQTLHRARERFAELLIDEVGRSLQTSAADWVEQELIDLKLLAYCRPALDRRAGKG